MQQALRFEFLPNIESTRISASVSFPIGTPFEVTERAAERLVAGAERVNAEAGGLEFRAISRTVGGQVSTGGGPFGGGRVTMPDQPLHALVFYLKAKRSKRDHDSSALAG